MSAASRKGHAFERLVADYLRDHVDDRIDIRPKSGVKDRGDIGGVRLATGGRVVIECKNHARMSLPAWLAEADVERGNDDAAVGVVVHKRHGKGAAAEQYVTLTLAGLVALLGGAA